MTITLTVIKIMVTLKILVTMEIRLKRKAETNAITRRITGRASKTILNAVGQMVSGTKFDDLESSGQYR